jgi:putative transposase
VREKLAVSERRACEVLGQPRSTQRYAVHEDEFEKRLVKRMLELVREHPRFGYRRITALLQQESWKVNRKRIYRLWVAEGLKVPRKVRKKRAVGTKTGGCVRRQAEYKNHVWTWDFIFDRTANGRSVKILSIVDEFTRECLALTVNRRLKSTDVIDVLADLFVIRGIPKCIRSDNGPEFVAKAIQRWLAKAGVETLYITPGSPWENGFVESFHSRLRDELLNPEIFDNIPHARALVDAWKNDYNHRRPHSALNYQTPAAFSAGCLTSAPASTPALQPGNPQRSNFLPIFQTYSHNVWYRKWRRSTT